MVQRRLLVLLGLCATAVFAVSATIWGADEPAAAQHEGHNAHMQHCGKVCADCMLACESCARHCAHEVAAGHKDHMTTLGTCADCGDICATAAKLCAREGPFAVTLCEACAKACATCGAACGKFPDDKHMAECAKICLDCEKVCRDMIEQAGKTSK